jgi:diguanylate cyclase (GGDEF)-like protein
MTLHRKTVLFLVCISLLMFTAFYITSRIIVMNGFRQVELKNSEQNMKFTLHTLEYEGRDIGDLAVNYSAWNDTYNFVARNHPGDNSEDPYIVSNYDSTTFTENDLSLILLLNRKNGLLFGKVLAPGQDQDSPVPSGLISRLESGRFLNFPDTTTRNVGIISTSFGPMLVVSEPITSNASGSPANGVMVMGRLISTAEIANLSTKTNISIKVLPLDPRSIPSSASEIKTGWIHSIFWTTLDNVDADSYAEIMDINGKPVLNLEIHMPKEIMQRGQHTLRYFVVFLIFVSLGYSISILLFFESSILKRMHQFMNGIEFVRRAGNFSARVKVTGQDEIAKLETTFNELMASLEESHRIIQHQAHYDSLTGLLNRDHFHQILRKTLTIAKCQGIPFTLIFMDVDKFKSINDHFGHDVGDLLLKCVAERLKNSIGKTGSAARRGGDEFTALLPEIGCSEENDDLIVSIMNQLSEPYELMEYGISVTASVGYSQFPADGVDEGMLLKAADRYMFTIKHDKFACKGFHKSRMRDQITRTLQLEQDIAAALADNQFYTVYQPKVDTFTQEIVGVEALLRWNHPVLGAISPVEFIPIAERTSYMSAIGAWTMQRACADYAKWVRNGAKKLRVAVNISSMQFMSPTLLSSISDILHETGFDPELLELEITESLAMQNVHEVIKILSHLKQMGIKIAIDDFGTGYSSLSYLSRFPIDFLKIDKSFIDGMYQNDNDMKIVKGIIELAHYLNFSVIAEGVETKEQYELLKDLRSDEIQGYLFGKPMTEDALFDRLKRSPEGLSTGI